MNTTAICHCHRGPEEKPHNAEVIFHWSSEAYGHAHYPVCLAYAKFLRTTFINITVKR